MTVTKPEKDEKEEKDRNMKDTEGKREKGIEKMFIVSSS